MFKLHPPKRFDDPNQDPLTTTGTEDVLDGDLKDPLTDAATLIKPEIMDGDPPPDDEPDAGKIEADVTKKMSRSLFDWRITDEEANQSFDALLTLPDDKLTTSLQKLGKSGKLKTLLEQIPAETWRSRTEDVKRFFRLSPADVLEKHIRSLLKVGLFDWVVSDADVSVVLAALAVLPQGARDAFVNDENGYFYDRLMAAKETERIQTEQKSKQEEQKKQAEVDNPTVTVQTTTNDQPTTKVANTVVQDDKRTKDGDKDGPKNKETPKEKGPGFFKKVGAGARILGDVFGEAKVDLDDVETVMGGDIKGIKLDESAGNEIDLGAEWSRGLMYVDIPSIGIESVAMDGVTASASSLKGLRGELKFKTIADKGSWISLDIASLDLGEVHLKVGEDDYAIQGLTIDGAHIKATDSPITQSKPLGKGEALKLLLNQIADGIGLSLPAIKSILSKDYEKPETLKEHFGKEFGSDANIGLTVAGIHLKEVVRNGQPMAQSLDMTGLSVEVMDVSLLPRLEEEAAKLRKKSETAKLDDHDKNRLVALDKQIAEFPQKDARLKELEAKAEAGTLSRKEQNALIELRNELRVGALRLAVDQLDTGEIDAFGQGVQSSHITGLDVTVTGGVFDDMRHHQSEREQLDDLIGASDPDAELIENKPTPGMKVSGGAKSLDIDGLKYTDAAMGTTTLSTDAKDVSFGYDMTTSDLSLKAGEFNVDQLHFGEGANSDYAAYETKLNHAGGKNLDFAMNYTDRNDPDRYNISGSAEGLVGDGLEMPGYKTNVGSFSADAAGFTMNEDGDVHAQGSGVAATDIQYLEEGMETGIGKVSADDFVFDMSERTEGNKTRSVMTASGNGAHVEGLEYQPNKVHAGTVDAGTFGFSMIDESDGNGGTTSRIDLTGSDVAATGVEYMEEGSETKIDGVSSGTLDFSMETAEQDGKTVRSDMIVTGDDLKMQGLEYAPEKVGIGGLTADTYAFQMSDRLDEDGKLGTTMDATGTGLHADQFTMGQAGTAGYTGVKKVDASTGNFHMNPDGSLHADASDVKAGGIVNGTGTGQISVGTAKVKELGYDQAANGDANLTTKKVSAGNVQIGDRKTGTHIDGVASSNVDVAMTDDRTVVNSGWVGATGVKSKSSGVGVDNANVHGLQVVVGDGATTIDSKKFDAKGLTWTDTDKKDQKTPDLTVADANGSGLHVGIGDDGTVAADVKKLQTGDIKYGSTDHCNTGALIKGTSADNLHFGMDQDGMDVSADALDVGETWIRNEERLSYLKSANVKDASATDMDFSQGFAGNVDIGELHATDFRTIDDDQGGKQVTNVKQLDATGLCATGTGDAVTFGANTIHADGVKHKDDGMSASAGTVDVTTLNGGISGLSTGKVNFDGATMGNITATDIHGGAEIWNLLGKKTDPNAQQSGTTPTTEEPAGDFKADALATASGRVKATIPIDIDLGWAGSLKADAVLNIVAKDGKVDIKAISVDLTNMNAYGWLASQLVDAVNPSLSADSDGNLELYFEIPIAYSPDIPIWVNIWDGSDAGVSGGWFAPNVISLQGLVEGLMKPKQQKGKQTNIERPDTRDPRQNLNPTDATYVSPQYLGLQDLPTTTFADPTVGTTDSPKSDFGDVRVPEEDKAKFIMPQKSTTETVEEKLDESVTPYINVKRARVDITGLKLGDGKIGNNNYGATLYGSKEGANEINGSIVGGGGGSIDSKKIRANDVYVKDAFSAGNLEVDDLSLKTERLVDGQKLNKKQKVGGDIGRVSATGVTIAGSKPK